MIKEFRKFFNNAVGGTVGEYKAYIIKNNPLDAERIRALLNLLDKNGIEYGTGTGSGKGFNYHTGKKTHLRWQPEIYCKYGTTQSGHDKSII
ncbi:MAG: hypothetical protein WDO71_10565 [Bacteroidota bacterium]